MKIHFLLLALLAFVALSQHNVDARLHDPAIRRMTEHRLLRRMTERNLLDELLQRRMEELEEMEGEQGSFQDEFVESRRLGKSCSSHGDCPCIQKPGVDYHYCSGFCIFSSGTCDMNPW